MQEQDTGAWPWAAIGPEGLRFYGRMSASISHEIKNVLAIVNENAGLLNDLVMMADRGAAVEPQRLVGIATTIGRQVRRADEIVKNLNRFAHSSDHLLAAANPREVVELVIALARRFALNRGIKLEFTSPTNPAPELHTSPFFLADLAWLGLDFAMDLAGSGKTVLMVMEEREGRLELAYNSLEQLAESGLVFADDSRVAALGSLLGADLWQESEHLRFGFRMPLS